MKNHFSSLIRNAARYTQLACTCPNISIRYRYVLPYIIQTRYCFKKGSQRRPQTLAMEGGNEKKNYVSNNILYINTVSTSGPTAMLNARIRLFLSRRGKGNNSHRSPVRTPLSQCHKWWSWPTTHPMKNHDGSCIYLPFGPNFVCKYTRVTALLEKRTRTSRDISLSPIVLSPIMSTRFGSHGFSFRRWYKSL